MAADARYLDARPADLLPPGDVGAAQRVEYRSNCYWEAGHACVLVIEAVSHLRQTRDATKGNINPALTKRERSMFLAIAGVLLVMWILGFAAFHVAGALIHLLLVIAVVSMIVHFVSRRSTTA